MKTPPNLHVSLIQTSLFWEIRADNLNHFEGLIGALQGKTDIIVLPEMFTSGFSMNTSDCDTMGGETMRWMAKMARELDAVLCGSIRMEEDGNYYNRFIWMRPDGTYEKYDKRHLFSFANEDDHFTRGEEKLIIGHKGWKIMPLVCYDLRFPVWSKNRLIDGEPEYDVLIYVANWPKARNVAWKTLLLARAIENQAYVAGVNRVGVDGKDIEYSGDSALISPYGAYLAEASAEQEDIIQAELEYGLLSDFRAKFPLLRDADPFEIR